MHPPEFTPAAARAIPGVTPDSEGQARPRHQRLLAQGHPFHEQVHPAAQQHRQPGPCLVVVGVGAGDGDAV